MSLLWRVAACLLMPLTAQAITVTTFDHAKTLNAGEIELTIGGLYGDQVATFETIGQFGLIEDLQVNAAAAVVQVKKDSGIEFAAAPRFSFARVKETGLVDLACGATASFLKANERWVLGADPVLYASRHFDLGGGRQIYGALSAGLALTWWTKEHSDSSIGALVSLGTGVDLVDRLRVALDGRWRDATLSGGVSATYRF